MEKCIALLIVCFAAAVAVSSGDPEGFISMDCGGTGSFVDDITKLTYTSDDKYIETGVKANVASNYKSSININFRTLFTLRSFPTGSRNCYNIKPVKRSSKYLIRAAFFHGNYDSHFSAQSNKPISFDLYIGASKWKMVNITDAGLYFWHEATIVALAEVLYVCLVNTGQGTPFISLLEMRPISSPLYPYVDENQFADLNRRLDFGGSNFTRYPTDKYDRIWFPVMLDEWTRISTQNQVETDFIGSDSELPSVVLQTAVIPSKSARSLSNLNLSWTKQDGIISLIVVNFHFAEVKQLPNSSIREFNIYYNGKIMYEHEQPMYLKANMIYTPKPVNIPSNLDEYSFTLNTTSNSTEPALMNAFEAFTILPVDTKMTDPADRDAILAIKTDYKINKGWTGDPCAPTNYTWIGLDCDYTDNSSKIISLNLSNSGLTGSISSSFSKLQNMKTLDLSSNGLKGAIPDFFATMTSLKLLNLSGNSLNCDLPDTLRKKSDSGVFLLVSDNKCTGNKPKKTTVLVIGSVTAAVVLVLLMVVLLIVLRRRRNIPQEHKPEMGMLEVQLKTQKFTKKDLEKITQNFTNKIGGGGFGDVFAGTLKDGTCVAVKKLLKATKQGHKEFLTEAENLSMLHHKNLLSLIGYCEEERCLALIYEYMPQGTLEDHIRGGTIGWRERLRIALEAAQGLEYLHKGCRMPIVHRDVKCSNILLGDNLEAKVADLGLARTFQSDDDQGTMATICGTPGYIDPEFFNSSVLTVKSDVYSFGIVLLVIITGLPPIFQDDCNLLDHVRHKLQREDITTVIDGRFQGDYEVNSVWKVLELAMSCTQKESARRPMISEVVAELKECLDLETNHLKRQSNGRQDTGTSGSASVGDQSSINGDVMGQQNMSSESFVVGYRRNHGADFEGMAGPSLR